MDPQERFPRLAHHLKEETSLAEEVDRCFSYIESLEQELREAASILEEAAAVLEARPELPPIPELPQLTELAPIQPMSPLQVVIDVAELARMDWNVDRIVYAAKRLQDELSPSPEVDSDR